MTENYGNIRDSLNEFRLYSDYRDSLSEFFWDETDPRIFPDPELVILNKRLIEDLGLDINDVRENLDILSGSRTMEGSHPIAQAYSGFQFGFYTRLGDGRANLLGELRIEDGSRKKGYRYMDLQLKGSGRTMYSRGGDGLASIGPMLREYIISEFLHKCGVPTSRIMSVFTTGEWIRRATPEVGAVAARTASSHIRVGTFNFAYEALDTEDVRALADYTIERHYEGLKDSDNRYIKLLESFIDAQAETIARWMSLGFIHGVMNTDNMTLSGESIDYGPCAFMEEYGEDTVFSSIDTMGRYRYGNQSEIGLWNISKFTESIYELLKEENSNEEIHRVLLTYRDRYRYYYTRLMAMKLGIESLKTLEDTMKERVERLTESFLSILKEESLDMTNAYRDLTLYFLGRESGQDRSIDGKSIISREEFSDFMEDLLRIHGDLGIGDPASVMRKVNPYIIPRNMVVDRVLKDAERGDYESLERLLEALENPFDYERTYDKEYLIPMSQEDRKSFRTYCGT